MSVLKFTAFGGEVPRLTKRSLPDNASQVCENMAADTPEFLPLAADSTTGVIAGASVNQTIKTLYRYPTGSDTIRGSTYALSLARSTITGDQHDRVYASMMQGETTAAPAVITPDGLFPNVQARPLGVPYPTSALTLAHATVTQTLMTPSEVAGFTQSVIQRIKTIVSEALELTWWNPAFALSGAAYRENPAATGVGAYQRVWTLANPGAEVPVWETHNSSSWLRHVWVAEANPPSEMSGSQRKFFYNFQAKVGVYVMKADVSAQTAKLAALVLPDTTTRLLTDQAIDALWTALRAILPSTPTATSSPDLSSLFARFSTGYSALTTYLNDGFDATVTPQAGYQLVLRATLDVKATADAISAAYTDLATDHFDRAVVEYLTESRVLTDTIPDGESAIEELIFYTYTYVNDRGEESKPYLPGDGNSNTDIPSITCNQVQNAQVTRQNDHPAGNNITHWRVYRSAAGADAAAFMFVAEIPIATTTFTDLRRTDQLSESMVSMTWFPPPVVNGEHLRHLVSVPGGFLAGFIGDTVYFSEVHHPYAWPPEYAMQCSDQIVALGVFGVTLVVLTKGGPVFISGSAPETMTKVELESNEVCQSPRSVVPVEGGVLFVSQNGLCVASQSGVKVLTSSLFTSNGWLALSPQNMMCAELDGTVYIGHTNGLLFAALHIPTGKMVRINTVVTAFYSDFSTGELFAALPPASGQIATHVKLFAGSGSRTGRWRSKRIVLEKEAGFSWMAVEGLQSVAQPLNVSIYGYVTNAAGVEVETKIGTQVQSGTFSAVVTDTRPFRVSPGRFKDFEVEISGVCRVDSILLASSSEELKGVA